MNTGSGRALPTASLMVPRDAARQPCRRVVTEALPGVIWRSVGGLFTRWWGREERRNTPDRGGSESFGSRPGPGFAG